MALKIGDRVRENTSSTGVGGLSLTGAPAGFQRFSAILASGDTTYYSLEENDKFEVGIGTYGSNNLERTTVLSSSNSGDKIELGGSGVVFITYPASRAIFSSETGQFVLGASGLLFANGTNVKEGKLIELADVSLSGTPVQDSVFDLNITNKSLSIGDQTGPTNSNNILIGYGAGSGITSGSDSVIIGAECSTINKTGFKNVHIGSKSGPVNPSSSTVVYNTVAVGHNAGNKMRHNSTAVGFEAASDSYEIGFTAMGYQAASGVGSYSSSFGYQAGTLLSEDYSISIGYRAGYQGAGESSIWIGQSAGQSSSSSSKTIGIGRNAGKSADSNECIYIGESAGSSNSVDNLLFIANSSPSSNGTLIKGDMDTKRVAVGVADVTLSDTLFVGVNSANDEGIVVKGAASQVSNLTSWKNNSDITLASVSKNGVVSAHEIVATGNGIQIASLVPASTTNKLYNNSGELYFNGSAVGGGDVSTAQLNYVSGIAVYGSGQTILNQNNITALLTASGTAVSLIASSGVATYASGQAIQNESAIATNTDRSIYASGQAIANEDDIFAVSGIAAYASGNIGVGDVTTAQLNYVSGIAVYASGHVHDDLYVSGVASYASGQVISNQSSITTNTSNISTNTSNISTNTARVNYASGQAIANESDIVAVSGIATKTFTVTAADSSNYTIDGMGLNSDTDPTIYLHKGHTYYFNKQTSGHPFRVSTSNGGSAYQDADGNNIEISGQGVLKFEVPQNAPDKLYYYCTSHAAMNGVIYTTNNVDEIIHVSGIAAYGSGQAISNQSNITALNTASGIATSLLAVSGTATSLVATSGVATYASGQAVSNQSNITALLTASGTATSLIASSGIASYASGQAIANESDIFAVSGIAAYASGTSGAGGSITVKEADGSPNVSNVTTIVVSNGTLTDNGGGQVTVTTGGSGGGGDVTTAQLNYVSGIAVYSSGQSISNQSNITALSTASGIATSLLAVSGTATSLIASSGIATYASGQAIANESDILATSGIAHYASGQAGGSSLTAGSGITIDGESKINVYGGSGHFINLAVDGAFSATTKSFLIDHPTKDGMKLQYGSLEGPENGVYVRGTSGSNIITLPEYWSTLVDQSTVTVSLTPIGYYQALYVEEKGKNYIKVGGAKGSYDYVVYGERKDVEKLKVEW